MTHAPRPRRRFRPWSAALSLAAAASLAIAPAPLLAAPAKRGKKAKATAAAAEPATDGKTIAMFRFAGAEAGADLRGKMVLKFQEGGYSVKSVALELPEASAKVKCPADAAEGDACLAKIGEWLNANPKTAADYLVWGGLDGTQSTTAIYDIKAAKVVDRFETTMAQGDLIAPLVLPQAVVTAVDHSIEPPPPATEEELAAVAALDEPDKTPEELAAEQREIEEAQKAAEQALQDQVVDTSQIEADLKEDFEDFCRTGKRKKRKTKEEPKDLRPKCQRGPFWGYWQPRTWVALTLTSGAAVATGLMYGLALGARGPYTDAVDALDAYNASVGGDPTRDPNLVDNGDARYDALATEVSQTGSVMRRRAIVGDVLLGTTVLLGGVMAIMIFQDRSDAKKFIREEKALRSISNLRVGPILTKDTQGAGASFRF